MRRALALSALSGASLALIRAHPPRPRPLPGDSLIRRAALTSTVDALLPVPPRDVWPWLVQMGAGRAGWYSVDRLDNGGVRSAHEIVPHLQNLRVGDVLAGAVSGGMGFTVVTLDPARALVMVLRTARGRMRASYAYVLDEAEGGSTRITTRLRIGGRPRVLPAAASPLIGLGHAVTQRIQLANIRRRVTRRG